MNRVSRSITALTTLAVLGSVALSPLAALADTSVNESGSVDINTKHSLFEADASTSASTSIRQRDEERAKQQVENRLQKVEDHTHASLNARIELLKNLAARIERMKRIGDDEKTTLNTEIEAELSNLNASSTSSTTLKMHLRSFAVLAPRAAIMAAGDRISAIVDAMNTIGTKLSARIDAAKAAGKDVTAATAAYADFQLKVADAKAQASAAVALIKDLKTDNVDQATLDADKQAITSARAKIKAAEADLKAARKDMKTILQGTASVGVTASTTAETH